MFDNVAVLSRLEQDHEAQSLKKVMYVVMLVCMSCARVTCGQSFQC